MYERLVEQIRPDRTALLEHSIYKQIHDIESLRLFMKSHVFAVWDFMTLLKSLQRQLTCVDLPWIPPADTLSARLINEIVLVEETDEISPDFYTSHFDLYLSAMEEVGADTRPILLFINLLQQGLAPDKALSTVPIAECTKHFVLSTLKSARGLTHEIAAAFLLGREEVIPPMFREIIIRLERNNIECNSFKIYLERHNQIDEEHHAPMGKVLLKNICGENTNKWDQALQSAQNAVNARISLWDGVNYELLNLSRV